MLNVQRFLTPWYLFCFVLFRVMNINDWITILFLGPKSRHSSKGHLVFWPNNLTDSPTHQEIPHLLSYRSLIPSLVSSLASFKTQFSVTCPMKHYLILKNLSTFS